MEELQNAGTSALKASGWSVTGVVSGGIDRDKFFIKTLISSQSFPILYISEIDLRMIKLLSIRSYSSIWSLIATISSIASFTDFLMDSAK
jgi:hypothetical protein